MMFAMVTAIVLAVLAGWAALALLVGVVIGRAIRDADRRELEVTEGIEQ